MRKAFFPALWLFCAALPTATKAQSRSDGNARAYIAQFKDLAISEQKRTGMPAAIKLAQGLHETGAGTSRLATLANNHFGMKCKRDWKGETLDHTDDAPNECFRKYPSAEESYRDQGNYLRNNPRYATCFSTDVKDYKTWAIELRRAGYATNPKYADKLTKTIEDYNLQQYTLIAAGEQPDTEAQEAPRPTASEVVRQDLRTITNEAAKIPEKAKELLHEVARVPEKAKALVENTFQKSSGEAQLETYKGLQGFYARAGQSLLAEATRFNVRYAKLLEWNDLPDGPLPYDMFVFLEKKPARGSAATHIVKPGETLHQIAQLEAVQLASLRQFNMIDLGEEPQPGAVLQLQKGATSRPAVYLPSQQHLPGAVADAPQNDLWTKTEPVASIEKPVEDVVEAPEAPPVAAKPEPVVAREEKVVPIPVVVEPEKAVAPPPVVADPLPTTPEEPVAVAPTPPPVPVAEAPKPDHPFIAKSDINDTPAPPVVATPVPPPAPVATAEAPAEAFTTPVAAAEPVYDDTPLGRLKAKMDRAVYARQNGATEPAPVEKPAPEAPRRETVTANRPSFHTVGKGETVFGIAKKYGISVTELRKWNSMDFTALKEGQKLKLKP